MQKIRNELNTHTKKKGQERDKDGKWKSHETHEDEPLKIKQEITENQNKRFTPHNISFI